MLGLLVRLDYFEDVDDASPCSRRLFMLLRRRWLLHERVEVGIVLDQSSGTAIVVTKNTQSFAHASEALLEFALGLQEICVDVG